MKRGNSRAILLTHRTLNTNVLSRVALHRERLIEPRTQASSEANSAFPSLSEVTGVVTTARIERPLLYRGGSASTETISVASPPLLESSVFLEPILLGSRFLRD